MINLEYIYNYYDICYEKLIKLLISMKLSQYLVKMWTNRPLGLNTNF